MNKKNTEHLARNYPSLYRDLGANPRQSCMAFGLEVGDGWFKIIDELSAKLNPLGVVASQVKEKYGTLRFYTYNNTDEAFNYIDDAEALTEVTCELCGEPGTMSDKGWVKVRCEECKDKYASQCDTDQASQTEPESDQEESSL